MNTWHKLPFAQVKDSRDENGKITRFLAAHKRAIVWSLVFAWAAFRVVHPDEEGRFFDLFFLALLVMLIASQIFWLRGILDLGKSFIPGKPRRAWLAVITAAVYLFFFAYSFTHLGVIHQATMGHIRASERGLMIRWRNLNARFHYQSRTSCSLIFRLREAPQRNGAAGILASNQVG